MFGWKRRPKPLALVPFAEAPPRLFNTILCDGVTAHNLSSFAELRALHARLQAERPDQRVLASLDDLGQAAYTSGHGTEVHRLDDVADSLPLHPTDFPNRLANLLRGTAALEDVRGLLLWETSGDANDPITINRDPEAALRIVHEREVIFQFVPVEAAADAIAAFPNGYFNGDLNPFQNHALARYLETEYGLCLFGLGSRFLAFRRELPLSGEEAQHLAAALCGLYAGTPQAALGEFAELLAGSDWLLLRYTES